MITEMLTGIKQKVDKVDVAAGKQKGKLWHKRAVFLPTKWPNLGQI